MAPTNTQQALKGKKNQAGTGKGAQKNRIGKADAGKTNVTAEQRKREVKDNLRKLNAFLETSRAEHETYRQRLQELAEAYGNGAHPEYKDEFERRTNEFDDMTEKLRGYEKEVSDLTSEQRELEDMQGVEETSGSEALASGPTDSNSTGGGLFVASNNHGSSTSTNNTTGVSTEFIPAGSAFDPSQPSHHSGSSLDDPPDGPIVNLTGPDGTQRPITVDDPSDAGLFTPADLKEVTGRSDDGEVVAWREQGNSKPIIVGYGPPNARRYERSTSAKSGLAINIDTTDKFGPDDRLGDEKVEKRYVRKYHEFKGIQGEAFDGPVEALVPRQKGEKGRKYPRIELWVKWEINGETKRTWEVRSSIKHLWPNPYQCDEYIYLAAKHHAEQHQQWLNGQRQAKEKSPTPSPGMGKSMPQGQQGRGTSVKTEESESNGTSSAKNATSEKDRMLQYREQWCDLEGLDPQKLTQKQKFEFLKQWNEIKDD